MYPIKQIDIMVSPKELPFCYLFNHGCQRAMTIFEGIVLM